MPCPHLHLLPSHFPSHFPSYCPTLTLPLHPLRSLHQYGVWAANAFFFLSVAYVVCKRVRVLSLVHLIVGQLSGDSALLSSSASTDGVGHMGTGASAGVGVGGAIEAALGDLQQTAVEITGAGGMQEAPGVPTSSSSSSSSRSSSSTGANAHSKRVEVDVDVDGDSPAVAAQFVYATHAYHAGGGGDAAVAAVHMDMDMNMGIREPVWPNDTGGREEEGDGGAERESVVKEEVEEEAVAWEVSIDGDVSSAGVERWQEREGDGDGDGDGDGEGGESAAAVAVEAAAVAGEAAQRGGGERGSMNGQRRRDRRANNKKNNNNDNDNNNSNSEDWEAPPPRKRSRRAQSSGPRRGVPI